MACYDSLYISCRWNRWLIELCLFCIAFSNNPSLGDTLVVLQFSHGEHHGAISFLSTKYGLDGVSNFLSIVLYQASPTSAVDEAFCPILFNIRNTGSCEGSCTTRSTPRSHNYELSSTNNGCRRALGSFSPSAKVPQDCFEAKMCMEMEMDSHGGLKVTIRENFVKQRSHPLAGQAQACGRGS